MLTKEENELLCRVGPETPMGKMMRRYWIPALLSSDLEANGDPQRVRLLGEDLVAFRDDQGRVGLLDELCPHRRASLALGRNENGALECLYHGWRIDCTGRILDMPVEPEDSTFKDRIRATAYSTYEAGGVIWAYMGPAGLEPPRPSFYFTQVPPERVLIMRAQTLTNWAQGLEGVIDSSHTNLLHQNGVRPSSDGGDKTIQRDDGTRAGLRATRARAWKPRTPRTVSAMPRFASRSSTRRSRSTFASRCSSRRSTRCSRRRKGWVWMQAFTPIDDEHTMFWFFQVSDTPLSEEQRNEDPRVLPHAAGYRSRRTTPAARQPREPLAARSGRDAARREPHRNRRRQP